MAKRKAARPRGPRGMGTVRWHRGRCYARIGIGGEIYETSFAVGRDRRSVEADARAWIEATKVDHRRHVQLKLPRPDPQDKRRTFEDAWRALVYARTHTGGSREKRWSDGMTRYLRGHCKGVLAVFQNRTLRSFTPEELERWLNNQIGRLILRRGRDCAGQPSGRVVSAASVRKYEQVLRQVLAFAVQQKWIAVSPMERVSGTHVPRTRPARAFRADELRAILDAAIELEREAVAQLAAAAPGAPRRALELRARSARRDRIFFTTLALTGMRREEIFRMRWGWITAPGTLWVRDAKAGQDRYDQEISLAKRAQLALKEWGERPPGRLVFPSYPIQIGPRGACTEADEQPLTDMRAPLRRILARAKVDPARATLHTFRHTYLSLLDAAGVRYAVYRALARHTSGEITTRYLHADFEAHSLALDQLERLLFGGLRVVPFRSGTAA